MAPSRRKARSAERVRFREDPLGFLCLRLDDGRCGDRNFLLEGGILIPARRAFDRPIAIACLADLAPCTPCRICSISSRTNSPAWVDGDLPSRLSRWALSRVLFSGISTAPLAALDCACTELELSGRPILSGVCHRYGCLIRVSREKRKAPESHLISRNLLPAPDLLDHLCDHPLIDLGADIGAISHDDSQCLQ